MAELLSGMCGLVVGIAVAWAIFAWRGAALREAAGRQEAVAQELRMQLAAREETAAALRRELDGERVTRVAAETRVAEMVKNVEEQRRLLDDAQKKLREVFTALAAESLRANSQAFSEQTEARLKPLKEALTRYESLVREMDAARQKAYGGLTEHLVRTNEAADALRREALGLKEALRNPVKRGSWGELTLRRVVEVAGMQEHCDFDVQSTITTENGTLRPDAVVHLPGGRDIIIDAKAPRDAYLAAMDESDEARSREQLERFARAVRARVTELSRKDYAAQFDAAPDFVVLFLPGEAFFRAAVDADPELIEFAAGCRVMLTSPTSLIALLRVVAYGWEEQKVAENARKIAEAGRELYERVCTFVEHLGMVGEGLRRAVDAYNKAIGSLESRVLPSGRRLKELGVASQNQELPSPALLEAVLRAPPGVA